MEKSTILIAAAVKMEFTVFNRHRTDGAFEAAPVTFRSYVYNGATTSTTYPGLSQGPGTTRATSDVVTKDFHRLVKSGDNPFASVKEIHMITNGMRTLTAPPPYTTGQNWKTDWSRTAIGFDKRLIPLDYESAITEACTQALANISKPTAQAGVFLAQFGQLMTLLKAPLSGVAQAIQGFQRGSRSKTAAGVSSQYLAFVFGVLPAMKDIEDILKAFQTELHKRNTARGYSVRQATLNWTRPFSTSDCTGTITGQGSRTVIVRAGSLYETSFDFGFSQFGLSVQNIPSIALEVIPYSFIADWFTNLSNVVNALTPTIGTNRLAEWYSIRDTVMHYESLALTAAIPSTNTVSGGGDTATSVVETRLRYPTDLGGHLGLVWNPSIHAFQIAASVALITQKITTGKTGAALKSAYLARGVHTS